MIGDFKTCCFHVVSLSRQQSNKLAMLSKPYSSAQMKRKQDEWSLRDSCGAAALRETPTESAKIEGSLWTVGHEKRIKDFLELSEKELALTRPTVLHHQEPRVLERFNVVSCLELVR